MLRNRVLIIGFGAIIFCLLPNLKLLQLHIFAEDTTISPTVPTGSPTNTLTDTPTSSPTSTPTQTPTLTPSLTASPTPTLTNTPTPTPTNEPNDNNPEETPTDTPVPTPTDTVEESAEVMPPDPLDQESPTPENQRMIGPPVPQQRQQQPAQKGDVKSAFSDESGPADIFDSKPNKGTSDVIKVIVTVIALTTAGIIGWLAIKSNGKMKVEEGSEDSANKPNPPLE